MAGRERVFNPSKRRVLRAYISTTEMMFSAGLLILLPIMGWWVMSRKNRFDPAERDISMDVLTGQSVEDTLYRTPLARWAEPGAPREDRPHLGIFPPGMLDGGWIVSSRPREFDPSNLYEKIDGSAPFYIERGFRTLHFIGIEQPDADLGMDVFLYDQGDFQNALDIFGAQKSGESEVHTIGRDLFYYKLGNGCVGIMGPYYIKLEGRQQAAGNVRKAERLLHAFLSLQQGSRKTPALFRMFHERLGIGFGDILYEKNNVFEYDFAGDFWFARPQAAGDALYYVHRAQDEGAARDLFQKIFTEQVHEYRVLDQAAQSVLFRHTFLNTYFSLNASGEYVYGLAGVADRNQVNTLRDLLKHALAGLAPALRRESGAWTNSDEILDAGMVRGAE